MYELMSTFLLLFKDYSPRFLMMRQWNKKQMLGFKLKKSNFVQSAPFQFKLN